MDKKRKMEKERGGRMGKEGGGRGKKEEREREEKKKDTSKLVSLADH